MNRRRLIGTVLIVAGIALIFVSNSIKAQVGEGRQKISRGQSQVNTIDNLFGQSQYTKPVGRAITSPAQRQINQGIMDANHYAEVANWCMIGGIGLIIVGGGMILLPARRK